MRRASGVCLDFPDLQNITYSELNLNRVSKIHNIKKKLD